MHHAINPDPYRGLFGSDGEKYAKDVEDLIQFGTSGRVAAFMSEAIQVLIPQGFTLSIYLTYNIVFIVL